MKLKLCLTLLAAALLARAADKSELIVLHHITPDEVRSMLNMLGVTVNSAPNGSVVLGGSENAVNAAEAIIKQVDVVRQAVNDVDFTVYMVVASHKEAAGRLLPSELDPVVKQLRSVFPYKSYTLLESSFLRVSGDNGRGSTDGYLPVHNPGEVPTNYRIIVNRLKVTSGDAESSVHIEQFELRLDTPIVKTTTDKEGKPSTYTQNRTVTLNTNVDMRVSQKVVVGKSNIDGSDEALIVVLTAKLEN